MSNFGKLSPAQRREQTQLVRQHSKALLKGPLEEKMKSASALLNTGHPGAHIVLFDALAHRDENVRRVASWALFGSVAYSSASSVELQKRYIREFGSWSDHAAPFFRHALNQSQDAEVRHAAVARLSQHSVPDLPLKSRHLLHSLLARARTDPNEVIRSVVAKTLPKNPDERAIQWLAQLTRDRSSFVSNAAYHSLESLLPWQNDYPNGYKRTIAILPFLSDLRWHYGHRYWQMDEEESTVNSLANAASKLRKPLTPKVRAAFVAQVRAIHSTVKAA